MTKLQCNTQKRPSLLMGRVGVDEGLLSGCYPSRALAFSKTLAVVNPNFSYNTLKGAEAPKSSLVTKASFRPPFRWGNLGIEELLSKAQVGKNPRSGFEDAVGMFRGEG